MQILKNSIWQSGALFSALLSISALPVMAEPNDKVEPSAEYTLQVNGSKVPLTLDSEITSKVAGKPLRFKLSRQPFRLFKKSGVQFQYPVTYSFEVDDSEPSITAWTLAQGDSTLIVNRFAKVPPSELSASIAEEITRQFGAKNVQISPMTFQVKGKSIPGKRLNVSLVGQKLVQDIFAFSTAKNSFVMVLQDVPINGQPSPQGANLKTLLTQTLKW